MNAASPESPVPWMRRTIISIVLLLVLGVPLAYFLWGLTAERRLNLTLAKLHAAGEPISPEQLQLGSVPDAQNASLDYLAAEDLVDISTPEWKKIEQSLNREYQVPLQPAEEGTVHSIVAQNIAAIDRAAAARGKLPGAWQSKVVIDPFQPFPDLNKTRSLCSLLRFAALDARAQSDDRNAVDLLSDMLSESDAVQRRTTLVAHLVAVGCTALTSETIERLAADFHIGVNGLSRSQLVALLNQLRNEREMQDGTKFSWRSERLFGLDFLRGAAGGFLPSIGLNGGTMQIQASMARFGVLEKPLVLQDARLYALYLQQTMTACTAPDWPAARQQMPTQLLSQIDAHPFAHSFLQMILPSFNSAVKVGYRGVTDRRLAAVALAVRLYAADHDDALPASLEDLVPAYLPTLPIDPMSGSPLKFKSNPPRVYSVGDDGIDDGGVPVDPDGDRFHREHGDIVVYLITQPRR